jgi:hypothetical protein
MLTRERFDAARRFVLAHARPLDRALFLHLFEGADARDVTEALRAFRNEDGGFGRALEPDIRLPDSSVTATTVALQYLRDARADAGDPLVRGAIAFLVARFDPALGGWPPVPARVTEHPHAPWWRPPSGGPRASLHLDAEVVGCLYEHRARVDPGFLAARSEAVRSALARRDVALGSYTALGLQRLAAAVPAALREEIFAALCDEVPATIDPDPERWGHDFQPFWLLVEGRTPLTEKLAPAIDRSLEREIARPAEDGSWPPRWSWSAFPRRPGYAAGDFASAWRQARREWAGEQTVRTLRALREAGRLPD